MIRAFLICGDITFCELLKKQFLDHADFEICGEARPDGDPIPRLTQADPDLIVLVTSIDDDFTLADEIKSTHPGLPIFWISAQLDIKAERRALRHGVEAVFVQNEDVNMLLVNARAVCEGGSRS